jgi:hypothetical protein
MVPYRTQHFVTFSPSFTSLYVSLTVRRERLAIAKLTQVARSNKRQNAGVTHPAHTGLTWRNPSGWPAQPGGTRQGGQPNQDKPGGTRQGGQPNQDKPGGTNFFWLPSPNKINLEEPISSGYPAPTGLIHSSVRL